VCGELSAEERQQLDHKSIRLASPAQSVRRPALLAELAWARWQAGEVDDEASLAPIYLHTDGSLPA
jgi:tRNA threonylcarbamoyladenosine biosynthesis protein TsaB